MDNNNSLKTWVTTRANSKIFFCVYRCFIYRKHRWVSQNLTRLTVMTDDTEIRELTSPHPRELDDVVSTMGVDSLASPW